LPDKYPQILRYQVKILIKKRYLYADMKSINTESTEFVETPLGVFTKNGHWYYITSDQVEQIAPGLQKKVSFEDIINDAEVWVKSSDTITLFFFVVLIQFIPSYIAAMLSMVFLYLWHQSKSAFVNDISTSIIKVLSFEGLILLVSVLSISYLGIQGQYTDVFYGLLFFIVFKFGWMRKGFDSFFTRYHKGIGLNDRVVKMLIIRKALRNEIEIPQVRHMEQNILNLMQKHKKKP
jgi:hypothetical protein